MGVRVIGGEPEHAEIEAERAGGCQHIPRKVSTLGLVKARMAEAEKAKEEAASSSPQRSAFLRAASRPTRELTPNSEHQTTPPVLCFLLLKFAESASPNALFIFSHPLFQFAPREGATFDLNRDGAGIVGRVRLTASPRGVGTRDGRELLATKPSSVPARFRDAFAGLGELASQAAPSRTT